MNDEDRARYIRARDERFPPAAIAAERGWDRGRAARRTSPPRVITVADRVNGRRLLDELARLHGKRGRSW